MPCQSLSFLISINRDPKILAVLRVCPVCIVHCFANSNTESSLESICHWFKKAKKDQSCSLHLPPPSPSSAQVSCCSDLITPTLTTPGGGRTRPMTAPAREEGTTHQSVQRMHKNMCFQQQKYLLNIHTTYFPRVGSVSAQ